MILLKRKKYDEILDEWLLEVKSNVKESTYATYKFHVEHHIKPYFNNKQISKIKKIEIQQFINYKLEYGRLDNRGGLSIKTVKDLINIIKQSFGYAINKNYIENMDLNFKINKIPDKVVLLDADDFSKLVNHLKDDDNYFSKGILLIMCTGMRIGEVCALKNSDINLNTKEIKINKTLQRIQDVSNKNKTKIIITETKTVNSKRIIPIPDSLLPYLKIQCNSNYYLTQTDKFIEPRVFRYRFKNKLKKLNLPEVTVHSLRHYFASQCIELGFDYKCLSEILGHSSPTTTMKLYVHSKKKYKKACMDRIKI
ncbi:hypothetical protein B5F09_06195 [Erysipelatoclostridium sp. An173]|uniref:tyrosine-type recombinase/integrase n=1 Tax=Erysipelatoclostridium sp. An173 TaxID=1965571 RepID=UPI000B3B06CC|nr:site-specific integrase [Erysipelatoclostridium sp. An173]OUP77370.1 hypothetical protein B5F09_06195 [Erysipelatoclostridium sp. An173]